MKSLALFFGVALPLLTYQVPAPVARVEQKGEAATLTRKFALPASGLEIERRTQPGSFLGVIGRRSALLGYENRTLEAWVYPLQILDRLELTFRLEGYPQEFRGADTLTLIRVRPEATTLTYSHAAFTIRQHLYAPVDESGIITLLEVDASLPLTVSVSFRPRLKLMWPAGLMTGNAGWDEEERAYLITEESGRYAGVVGSPAARDAGVMPYQEEPRDTPLSFTLATSPDRLGDIFIPVVIAGGVRGREEARATYRRLLGRARGLYEENTRHYRRLLEETTSVETPDERVNEALRWAKIGIDKGLGENPFLGRGLVAGFRTAGESERPGFAWFFGRDALWTSFALNSYGDFGTTRSALDFLKKFQRADGKIPHEISQSASLVPWFTDYEYPWASADATPLYIAAHADLLRASGDLAYTRANWDSILRAYSFTAATDTDRNGLVENTRFGHGWVEGGALYPPHEEIYQQGVWAGALEGLAEMAAALGDGAVAEQALSLAEKVRAAVESTLWLEEKGFYAFATNLPRDGPRRAESGPNRSVRQERMNELDRSRLIDEDTVLPAVPLWWGMLDGERAQSQLDHLGSARMATDWGTRIISDESRLYDPLSYHHGSVWPLFTGWASMGAYRYGRPHVGYQALMANVSLNHQNALGYVTELLSGDFNAPFGRSSHHQVWSQAMVVTPLVRGLLGLESSDAGRTIRFAPQLPADWDRLGVKNFRAARDAFDISLERGAGRLKIVLSGRADVGEGGQGRSPGSSKRILISPAFPLDARVRRTSVNNRPTSFSIRRRGDVQFAEVVFESAGAVNVIEFAYDEGSDVYVEREAPKPGGRSAGLRVLRSRAEEGGLRLLLEGSGGRPYSLGLISPRRPTTRSGIDIGREARGGVRLSFVLGPPGKYARRELFIPLAVKSR